MKITNAVLLNEEFMKSLQDFSSYRIPVSAGLKILRLYAALESEHKLLVEAKNGLIRKHGTRDEKGGYGIPATDEEALRRFYQDFNELVALESDFPGHEKIKLPAGLQDKDGKELHLDLKQLAMLSEIIEFED